MNTATGFPWFLFQVKSGIRYALYFVVIGFAMGMIYGAFGGMLWVPAAFSVGVIGVFCVLNFIVALLALLVNGVLAIFRRSSKAVFRYFGLSFGFVLVFLIYFYLIHIFKLEIF